MARVVSSGGKQVKVWKVSTAPKPALIKGPISPLLVGGQFPGFFTSVSSNGTTNPIIWALSRPPNSSATSPVYLYAFNPDATTDGTTMTQLFKGVAGNWPNLGGNANLVPVVANGRVYVASNQQLKIFGLKPPAQKK